MKKRPVKEFSIGKRLTLAHQLHLGLVNREKKLLNARVKERKKKNRQPLGHFSSVDFMSDSN